MKSVWWCHRCQLPLLEPTCELCGTEYSETLARDICPVFREEMLMLRNTLGITHLPKRGQDFYLWVSGQTYFKFGEKAFRTSYARSEKPWIADLSESAIRKRRRIPDSHEPYVERLYAANRSHLEILKAEARSFIESSLAKWGGRTPVVAFSGGKDSMAVSSLARNVLPAADLLHVFGDTGIESPDTTRFVSEFRSANPQIPFVHATPNVDFFEMCEVLGPPSRIKRWCCSTQKTFPLGVVYGALSQSGGVMSLCGVRRRESSRRKKHQRVYSHTKIGDELMICPIIEWSDAEVWLYLLTARCPINRAYRLGFRRVGCIYCPYNSKWSEFLTKTAYRACWSDWEGVLKGYYSRHGGEAEQGPVGSRWKARAGGLSRDDDLGRMDVTPCDGDEKSFSLRTQRDIPRDIWEYFRPFGGVSVNQHDGVIGQAVVVGGDSKPLFAARVAWPRRHLRVSVFVDKNQRLLGQRVVRQVKKAIACQLCGLCQVTCPTGAITCNGRYLVDAASCTNCLKCVTGVPSGCVAAHATKVSGRR